MTTITESWTKCDTCGKLIATGMPNGVHIEEGSAIHGESNTWFQGDFCSLVCFSKKFLEECERVKLH